MAAYETVQWQPGDEVTSQKLQQMANNAEYIKDTALVGDVQFLPSNTGEAPAGREPGIVQAQRVCAIRIDFDSQVPVDHHMIDISLKSLGFTEPPVIAISHFTGFVWSTAMIYQADRVDSCKVLVRECNGLTVQHKGNLHLVLVGR